MSDKFNQWANERRKLGHDIVAVKGYVPNQFYSDGTPVTGMMNVAWRDVVTGELFVLEYDVGSSDE